MFFMTFPSGFSDPGSAEELCKIQQILLFWYYMTSGTSDLKIHELFSNLLLPYKSELGCSLFPGVLLPVRLSVMQDNLFLMSEGHAWLEDFSFYFLSEEELLSLKF